MIEAEIAVIGGSGLYKMADLQDVKQVSVKTPFGDPSDDITLGNIFGETIAFLPRHGRGHRLTPSEIPYRANIYALKSLGVRYIISVSACGSLREDYEPGHIVIPDQIVDFTKGIRNASFFGQGLVAHVGAPSPFSHELSLALAQATADANGVVHYGGSFITIEGPRFSTKGESILYRNWGMSIIGMTTSPEVFLAAEAEIAYACMAHVTDYDVWHDTEQPVTVEMVIKILSANTELAQNAIKLMAKRKSQWAGEYEAHNNMREALSLVSDWSKIDEKVKRDLGIIINRYLPK